MMTGGSTLIVLALLVWTFCAAARGWRTFYKLAGISLLTWISVALLVWAFHMVERPQQDDLAIIAPGAAILISLAVWIFVVWKFDMTTKGTAGMWVRRRVHSAAAE